MFSVWCGMALSDLSSSQLQRLIQLIKEKESIQAQLEQVNNALAAFENGAPAVRSTATLAKTPARRRHRRSPLKAGLLKSLGAAGKKGLTVNDLAEALKADPRSVYAWFYTTGKKIKGIKKVGAAQFAYQPE